MARFILTSSLFVAALLWAPARLSATFTLGTNVIVNGGAESAAGSPNGFTTVAAPGWTSFGNFTVVEYTAGGGFPTPSDAGPAVRGLNFFAGGDNNASSSASQLINLANGAAIIDGGLVTFNLRGFFGGFDVQGDFATLIATFQDSSAVSLGTVSLGGVSNVDRGNATGLLARQTPGAVPIGTRQVNLTLQMTRVQGSYNDGYADNLSLVFQNGTAVATPLPATFLAFALGGVAIGVRARGRHAANNASL